MRHSQITCLWERVLQVIALFTCLILWARDALAYLDPVSTTFALQAIAGGIAAAIAGIRSFRRRVIGLFKTGRFVDPDASTKLAPEEIAGPVAQHAGDVEQPKS